MESTLTPGLKKRLLWLLTAYPQYFFRLGLDSFHLWQDTNINPTLCQKHRIPTNDLRQYDEQTLIPIEQWLKLPDHQILWYPDFPPTLKNIPDPPVLLFCEGNLDLINQRQLAIVGTRKPSIMGLAIAEKFAEIFTNYNIVITSGFATGIDTASHRGALKNQKTIAVIGTGILRTYPAQNQKLRQELLANHGLITSEFPLEAPPQAWHFPLRNRLISGLSNGVLVVEAGLRSGSLITARLAAEQGKEIFAIPGSIYHPQSQGTHYLISQGAKLVTKPEKEPN